ncbi:MAG: MBL fold metallo-hydrolase, partial [Gemmatimonadota bacterium]|nr:MBL fold metallo-hydrolase [Gemmatimonadota bacterium]
MRRGPRASLVVTATIVGATVAPGFGAAQPRPQSPQDRPAPQPFGLFLANEGIILVGGQGAVVVFDALFRDGVEGYQTISREGPTLEDPWHFAGGVTLAVASHHHPDHFDAPAVLAHLRTNPGTRFVSTETAVDLLRALNPTESVMSRVTASWPVEGERDLLDFGTVRLETLNLHHGRGRSPTVQNLGHLVEAGGLR